MGVCETSRSAEERKGGTDQRLISVHGSAIRIRACFATSRFQAASNLIGTGVGTTG